jgi:Carboxypeptidase regulatory-like domain/TonB dependent receptor
MKTILRLVLLGVFFGSCSALLAQGVGTGTISGTVTDANNAALPSASVRIVNTDTGTERLVTTTDSGDYRADLLQPGHYEVVISKAGFASFDRKNLTLLVGQVLGIDAALPLESVQSTVTVSAASPVLDTEKTEASQDVSQELVGNLPVNGRRYDNFVLLTPNVAPDGNSGLISYRGVSGIYNSNLVDGANNNQAFFSEARGRAIGAPYVYSQDSIKEFQSEASAYSAEFGQAVGGQINAITKSGTNQMHGDLFYYLRYPDLNALDPVGKTQGIFTQPVHQQQQFGGSVGGPFIKDKLFYFFTYDGFRKVNPILYTSTLPASTLATYASPANCPTGVSTAQCQAAIDYLLSLRGSYARTIKQDIFFPRLDWQINGANHVSANFNWQNFSEPNGYNTSPTASNGSVTQNGTANFHDRIFIANWDSVLSPRSVNQARLQWSRDLETFTANAPGPSVTITGVTSYGMPNALPRPAFPDEHRWQAADIYSTTLGRHSIKTGVDLNFIHELLINLFQGGGIYSYSAGSPLASFKNWVQDVYGLNGAMHYTNFTQVNDPITHVGKDDFWNKDLAAFVQDSWKLTPSFLINAGLRYDVQLVPQPPIPNTSSEVANYYTKTINIDYHMFQPRLGFSWQPMSTTVLRGGYGLVYGLNSNSTYYTIRVENGVFQQQYNAVPSNSYAVAAPNVLFLPPGPPLTAPFPGAATPQVTNTNPPLSALSARGLDPHFLNPYSHSFSLAVQQQMPYHSSLTLSWVGNRAMRLPIFIDTNVQPATATKTYDITNAAGQTTSSITLPFYTERISNNTSSVLTGFSTVNSWYNSFVASIEKPFDHGLELLVNYTWAKAIDGGQVSGQNGTFNGTDTPLDPFNLKAEYGRSDLDMRNRFVGSLVYAPSFNISSRPLSLLANGWTLSGTATAQTGFPVTAFMANYPTSPIGDGGLTGAELSLFNSGTGGRAPQVGRNAFPGPGLHNIDMRVTRSIPIHENIRMEFFAEAFNLVNHQNRLTVNTTAFSYAAPSAASTVCNSANHANACIYPSVVTGSAPFQATTSTSSLLYGPRQLQFSAKLFF